MEGSCLQFGSASPPLGWWKTCGFLIDGTSYTVDESPLYIQPGTTITPFVGFYTGFPDINPECGENSTIRIIFTNMDTEAEISVLQMTVEPNTQYDTWWMPSFVMPTSDIHVAWVMYIVEPSSGDLVYATETGTFTKRAVQCFEGETECRDGYLWECESSRWRNTYEPCGTVCTPGATDCNGPGGTRRTCNTSGQWVNTGEACGTTCTPGATDCNGPGGTRRTCNTSGQWVNTGESCNGTQECDPLNEPYKCVDCNLYRCNDGQWQLVGEPRMLEHIKYCGIQCNTPLVIGIAGATIAVAGLAYYLYTKKKR